MQESKWVFCCVCLCSKEAPFNHWNGSTQKLYLWIQNMLVFYGPSNFFIFLPPIFCMFQLSVVQKFGNVFNSGIWWRIVLLPASFGPWFDTSSLTAESGIFRSMERTNWSSWENQDTMRSCWYILRPACTPDWKISRHSFFIEPIVNKSPQAWLDFIIEVLTPNVLDFCCGRRAWTRDCPVDIAQ